MPGPHYRGIVWAHFSRLGSAWAMHISVGIPHSNSSGNRDVQKKAPITILRMEFFEEPYSQTNGIYMVESDIYTERIGLNSNPVSLSVGLSKDWIWRRSMNKLSLRMRQ
jgi:hypothetical protein